MFRKEKSTPELLGFRGVWAAAVTPHRREGYEPDFGAMLELVDRLSQTGIDGIVLLGATGEFLNVKVDERQRLVHLAVKRSRVPIIAGVSHSTLDSAVHLADAAVDSGVAGLLLMPPYFYRYQDEQIIEFYRMFSIAVGGALPIMLYNIPAFTNPISIAAARELLSTSEFIGIKDSSGDTQYLDELASMRNERPFSLFCGNDRVLVHARRKGCDGVISGVACAVPELVLALWRALNTSNDALAEKLEQHLLEFIHWIEQFPVPVGLAAATEARGFKVGPPALPLTSTQFDTLEEFKSWFADWLPRIQLLANA